MSPSSAEAVPPAVLCFGEILWDVFKEGEVIGGAPFNVAAHLTRLGLRAFIYSRLGSDDRGARARPATSRLRVSDRWLQQDDSHPTGWVDVALAPSGQPAFRMGANVAWDHVAIPSPETMRELKAERFSAIVCGTLASRSPGSRCALAEIRSSLCGVPASPETVPEYSDTLRPQLAGLA